jgi:hypothetical protein
MNFGGFFTIVKPLLGTSVFLFVWSIFVFEKIYDGHPILTVFSKIGEDVLASIKFMM